MSAIIHQGDCLVVMKTLPDSSVDAVVCDPPYAIGFMARAWDAGIPGPEYWAEALRVAKPGAFLVAFGGPRMHHRLMCAIEDAGWELRDAISGENVVWRWYYGSGFPKNLDVTKAIEAEQLKLWLEANPEQSERRRRLLRWAATKPRKRRKAWTKMIERGFQRLAKVERVDPKIPATPESAQWNGWGTALKPGWEPIIVARKPMEGTVAESVMTHGTGGLNIDGCRVGTSKEKPGGGPRRAPQGPAFGDLGNDDGTGTGWRTDIGRWPANVMLCHMPECNERGCAFECPVRVLDEQSGDLPGGWFSGEAERGIGFMGAESKADGSLPSRPLDGGGASRFFYTAKASREEREAGLHSRESQIVNDGRKTDIDNPYQRGDTLRKNTHPTVKPVAVMRWLVRLVCRRGGTVLDPFCGSGTTGIACKFEGVDFIGIDLEQEHVDIARKRIAQASLDAGEGTLEDAEQVGGFAQLGLFT